MVTMSLALWIENEDGTSGTVVGGQHCGQRQQKCLPGRRSLELEGNLRAQPRPDIRVLLGQRDRDRKRIRGACPGSNSVDPTSDGQPWQCREADLNRVTDTQTPHQPFRHIDINLLEAGGDDLEDALSRAYIGELFRILGCNLTCDRREQLCLIPVTRGSGHLGISRIHRTASALCLGYRRLVLLPGRVPAFDQIGLLLELGLGIDQTRPG